ncbi:helix-turn-helix domain-containing protein [Streptomyces sp. NPDC002566]|uniref:helix-turn-helix domain-containing protein n=1 Tax=Streptomyces sp. NPDC002566 TaxID=3364650 RepID=UPI00369B0250
MSAADFAELLRELKDRSGLSYGALAKRLHMSTSTLHRYCNGDAVPTDYAPVERLARLCKATPAQLVELHRRWVLADAGRGRKGSEASAGDDGADAAAAGGGAVSGTTVTADAVDGNGDGRVGGDGADAATAGGGAVSGTTVTADAVDGNGADRADAATEVLEGPVRDPGGPDGDGGAHDPGVRRRTRLVAVVGAATALGAVALALSLSLPGGDRDAGDARPAGAASAPGAVSGSPSASAPSLSPSPSPSSASPSASTVSPSGSLTPSRHARGGAAGAAPDPGAAAPPFTVDVRSHAWIDPCSQRYLIDREPDRVAPPPLEEHAPAWVAAHGAVPSGQQMVAVTVQGAGDETVVLNSLRVRTVEKRSPLAWNDYAMGYPGVGCGGGMPKRHFSVALDAVRPNPVPDAGSEDFPFTVSESDPEIYYISADASAYDVSWVLELSWSSGPRRGTLTVDDHGKPFRTSGNNGRPAYEFPVGGSAWGRAGASPTP